MAINNTESRIPAGFTKENASQLGYATDIAGHMCMVSYLPETLRFGDAFQTLFNNYVVFIDATKFPADADFTYAWTIEYLDSAGAVIHTYTEDRAEYLTGNYWLRMNDQDLHLFDLPGLKKLRVTCTVSEGNNDIVLILAHNIDPSYDDILDLFAEDEGGQVNAKAGHPAITHYVANIYREFFPAPMQWKGEDLDVPMNVPVSILYSRLLKFHFNLSPNGFVYQNGLNNDDLEWSDNHRRHQVGICGIKPYLLAMMLGSIPFQRLGDRVSEEDIFNTYLALINNDPAQLNKIDIFNYARFPKSNILLTAYMLSELKKKAQENDCAHYNGSDEDRATWKDLTKESMAYEKNFVRNLLTEFFEGPQVSINDFTYRAMGRPPKHDWASYLINILEQTYVNIPFELIRIKVLDIRSGQPIKRAQIKMLKIVYVQNIEEIFDSDAIVEEFIFDRLEGLPLITMAQKALIRFNYMDDTAQNKNGVWQPIHTQKTNEFLAKRKLDSIVTLEGDLNNDSVTANYTYVLQYIVDEYNRHGFTDDEGVLNIKIPETILDKSYVHLELGFHEFPITPERIAVSIEDPVYPITRNTYLESETNFNLRWIGGDDAGQEKEWEPTIDAITDILDSYTMEGNTAHFSWQVENLHNFTRSYLTVCTKLVIKDDGYLPFERLSTSHFSTYYDEIASPYHFVLFGMQWCQPVYDEFEDASDGTITSHSYVQHPDHKDLRMHLVTLPTDLGGSDKYGGKGYGKVEVRADPYWRSVNANTVDQAHLGLDIHAKIGDPVFAVRSGKADLLDYSDTGGNMVKVSWSGEVRNSITYLHLLERLVEDDEMVLPGTKLGLAGRTGNLGTKSSNAGHVHLNVGALPEEIALLREVPDEDNKIAIPFNEIPLLLPCACQVTSVLDLTEAEINDKSETLAGRQELASAALIPCRFDNVTYVDSCWAAAELKCPYIDPADKTNIQLQLLLRFLNEKPGPGERIEAFAVDNNPTYFHPGKIDGDIGNEPGAIADSSLDAGAEIGKLGASKHGGLLIKIRYTVPGTNVKKETWVESSLVDEENKLTQNLENLLAGNANIGKTRMAIYLFRKEHGLLDFSDYVSNFENDDDFWDSLHQQTGLV